MAMVGSSAALREVEQEIEYAARCNGKVLITGESGVGKEIVAHLIHQHGLRRNAPFVTVNCAGIPDTLLESEMFGHVKGSFTDAYRDKRGWLEQANGGTIFLDEVGEMSLRMQALLLRFMETGEIQRVGADRKLPALNVRVITATHRKLLDHVADKTFREDLYYRLNVIHVAVPPLRDRREDIPLLLDHFMRTFSASHRVPPPDVTREALECLQAYSWPGNVRELKNVAERLVLRCGQDRLDVRMLPPEIRLQRAGVTVNVTAYVEPTAGAPEVLFGRMVKGGESFWSAVYEPFMARDVTRSQVRELIRLGLQHTLGNYKLLVTTFNMAPGDYKRFLNFLRKYECHVPFQPFRNVPPRSESQLQGDFSTHTY